MALARQRADWLRTGVLAALLVNSNGFRKGKPLSPMKVIPPPFRPQRPPPRKRTPEEAEAESRRAWGVLDTMLGRMSGGR